MTSGVLLTGVVAMLFSRGGAESPAAQVFMNGGILAWVIILSPLAIVFAMSFGANKFSTTTLQAMFWGFATLMGLSLSTVFLVYTGGSIAATFFATAGAFAGLTAYDTQRLKQQYFHLRGTEFIGKAVILGALSLYLDFINMFQFLLSFMGQRD